MKPTKYRMEIDDHVRGHQLKNEKDVDHILWEVRKTGDTNTVTYYKVKQDWGSFYEVLWYSHEIVPAVEFTNKVNSYHEQTLKEIRNQSHDIMKEVVVR